MIGAIMADAATSSGKTAVPFYSNHELTERKAPKCALEDLRAVWNMADGAKLFEVQKNYYHTSLPTLFCAASFIQATTMNEYPFL